MRKAIWLLVVNITIVLILTPIVALAVLWSDLGVGYGSARKQEYMHLARIRLADGGIQEAARLSYFAIRMSIQSEIDWYLVRDDIDSFPQLMDTGHYAEADRICRRVQEWLEHGPGRDIWENFHADCAEASELHFNTAVLFCRDAGVWREEAAGSMLWYRIVNYCFDYYDSVGLG